MKVVVNPVCRSVEEELRKQIHCVLIQRLKQKNPYQEPVEDCYKYTSMMPLYLFEKKVHLKMEIKNYLSRIFYEMTALSPHDWMTYEHMRVLAKEKYDIAVAPSYLPA